MKIHNCHFCRNKTVHQTTLTAYIQAQREGGGGEEWQEKYDWNSNRNPYVSLVVILFVFLCCFFCQLSLWFSSLFRWHAAKCLLAHSLSISVTIIDGFSLILFIYLFELLCVYGVQRNTFSSNLRILDTSNLCQHRMRYAIVGFVHCRHGYLFIQYTFFFVSFRMYIQSKDSKSISLQAIRIAFGAFKFLPINTTDKISIRRVWAQIIMQEFKKNVQILCSHIKVIEFFNLFS